MATGLAIAACRQRKRVRFTTAAQLVNELTEAKNKSELNRVTNRWMRYELIVIDEMAYVAMPEAAAELLFQIIAGRARERRVIVTTNLPFSEWTTMFPNARLCKAMLDRLTDQAHIIETGNESYRFRRTLRRRVAVNKSFSLPRPALRPKTRRPSGSAGLRSGRGREKIHQRVGPNEAIKKGPNQVDESSSALL